MGHDGFACTSEPQNNDLLVTETTGFDAVFYAIPFFTSSFLHAYMYSRPFPPFFWSSWLSIYLLTQGHFQQIKLN